VRHRSLIFVLHLAKVPPDQTQDFHSVCTRYRTSLGQPPERDDPQHNAPSSPSFVHFLVGHHPRQGISRRFTSRYLYHSDSQLLVCIKPGRHIDAAGLFFEVTIILKMADGPAFKLHPDRHPISAFIESIKEKIGCLPGTMLSSLPACVLIIRRSKQGNNVL
jgi:hypothetical protein